MTASFGNLSTVLGWRSAKQAGAKGDGAADDTAALQAAIDDAHGAGGGVVVVQPGDFVLSDSGRGYCLLLPSNVVLLGSGAATRLQNSTAAADTIRCTGSGIDWSTYADYWGIASVHFNPAVGVTRNDSAAEVNVGLTRKGFLDLCGFGRRNRMNTGDAALSTAEESRVGTCIQAGNSGLATVGADLTISRCRGFGPYYRWLRVEKFLDIQMHHSISDANRADAQSLYLTGTVEGVGIHHCDVVNSRFGVPATGICLLIDSDGVEFNRFGPELYLDSHAQALDATGGQDNGFIGVWMTGVGASIARVRNTGTGYTFQGGIFAAGPGDGLSLESGIRHLVANNQFYGNNTNNTGTAHCHVGAAVASARITGNAFATSAGRLTSTHPFAAIQVESGAADVRSALNILGGLSIVNNAGSGYVSSLE